MVERGVSRHVPCEQVSNVTGEESREVCDFLGKRVEDERNARAFRTSSAEANTHPPGLVAEKAKLRKIGTNTTRRDGGRRKSIERRASNYLFCVSHVVVNSCPR